MPFDFPLYPRAKIVKALPGGAGTVIVSSANVDKLAEFYTDALKDQDYILELRETEAGAVNLFAINAESEKMNITIVPDENLNNRYILSFVKITN